MDDAALFLARLSGGAVATYEATRFATGRKNGLRVELRSLAFDFERMNELSFYDATLPVAEQGFTRILVTEPEHPYMAAWWPPGHPIGYEHTFTHEMRDLIEAIGAQTDPTPSFADAVRWKYVSTNPKKIEGGAWPTATTTSRCAALPSSLPSVRSKEGRLHCHP